MVLTSWGGHLTGREVNGRAAEKASLLPLGGPFCAWRFGPLSDFDSKSLPHSAPSGPGTAKSPESRILEWHLPAIGRAAEKTASPYTFLLGGLFCLLALGCFGRLRWFSVSGRQNPLDRCFHGHSRLIKQSDDVLNRVASRAGLTEEQPQPSCLDSQLMGVHLRERRFLVFFVVAHGGESITD